MIIERKYQPEKAASKDAARMVLESPYLDIGGNEGPVIVSTDGRIMSIVPVTLENGDSAGPVPVAALIAARKASRRDPADVATIALNGNTTAAGVTYPRTSTGKFPDWRQVVPSKDRKEVEITLNVELLLKLAQAIGAKDGVITLKIAKAEGPEGINATAPIKVGTAKGQAHGVLMPCRA